MISLLQLQIPSIVRIIACKFMCHLGMFMSLYIYIHIHIYIYIYTYYIQKISSDCRIIQYTWIYSKIFIEAAVLFLHQTSSAGFYDVSRGHLIKKVFIAIIVYIDKLRTHIIYILNLYCIVSLLIMSCVPIIDAGPYCALILILHLQT